MRYLNTIVLDLIRSPIKDLQLIGQALAIYSPATAERLKNAIAFGQQEADALDKLTAKKEMLLAAERSYDLDAIHFGERV